MKQIITKQQLKAVIALILINLFLIVTSFPVHELVHVGQAILIGAPLGDIRIGFMLNDWSWVSGDVPESFLDYAKSEAIGFVYFPWKEQVRFDEAPAYGIQFIFFIVLSMYFAYKVVMTEARMRR